MTKLENDYERMVPEYHHGMLMYGEHIMRYESVADIVKDKIVLDIASGSGYGTATLAKTANKVYGVDINEKAVNYSIENFGNKKTTFLVGSGTDIPLETDSVDIVVSHETIEHIDDYRKFMREIKRVLKNGGQAIISTPNDDEYPAGNHFHLHQFKVKEFKKLLQSYFTNVDLYYQGAWISAALLNEKEFTTEWRQSMETFKTQAQPTVKSTYVVAVCSDKKVSKLKSLAAYTEPWSDKELRELAQARQDEIQNIKDGYGKHIEKLEEQLRLITSSRSWRVTRPLRALNARRQKSTTKKSKK